MTRIPHDPNGYSVNLSAGTVHTRHPGDHAGPVQRTRTLAGVESLLDGRKGKVCRTCYANRPTVNVSAPQNGQVRRNAEALPRVRDTDPQDPVPAAHLPTEPGEG